jgi:hypothetical protein
MKKLIFNGCSFMAGDELVWEQYHKERNRELTPWLTTNSNNFTDSDHEFRFEYLTYRKQYNLPGVTSKILGCDCIDLSQDGKSNQNIALETIACLNSFNKEERKNCHVIIGWTSISRIMKYSTMSKMFVDLTVGHYDECTDDPAKNALKEHIKTRILGGDDEDFILDYVVNVILLENYLISNNITYTFYRGLDDLVYDITTIGPFSYSNPYKLKITECTNHENWYKFADDNRTPISGIGWGTEFFKKPHMWVTPKNPHPSLESISNFSARLLEFIKTQQVL